EGTDTVTRGPALLWVRPFFVSAKPRQIRGSAQLSGQVPVPAPPRLPPVLLSTAVPGPPPPTMSTPIPSPLYHPDQEHDACGVGFIAKLSGERTYDVVNRAVAALKALAHRGAVDADAVTGDGCGFLTQVPVE